MSADVQRWLRWMVALAVTGWLGLAVPLIARAETDETGSYRGRRVIDVLATLQAAGTRIVFSSSLVPPTLVVKSEPRGRTRRQVVSEILAEHRLALKDAPSGIWVVVKTPVAAAAPARAPQKRQDPKASTSGPPGRERREGATSEALQLPHVEEQVDVTERLGELARHPSVKALEVSEVRNTAGGFENVLHVLPLLPGVAATDDEQGKLAVRGAGPQHNVILFDGVQVHSPQRLGDFMSSFINPSIAESVALDASGLDARYGGRLSSVLVLETRDGLRDRRLAFSGSAGLTNGDVLVEGRLPGTQSGSWWVAARGTYYRFVADRFRGGTIPHFADVQFKITLRPTRHTQLSLVGLAGQEGEVLPLKSEADPVFIEGNTQHELDTDNRLAAANLWWTPNRRAATTTTITAYSNASTYQDHWKLPGNTVVGDGQIIEYAAGRPDGPFARRVRIRDVAVRQRAMFAWSPGYVLDSGVEVRRLQSSWFMSGGVYAPWGGSVGPNTWGELITDSRPIDVRMARTHVGTWLQQRIALVAGLELEPGLRMDWNSFTDEGAVQPRLRVTQRFGDTLVWGGLAWQAQTPGHETMQQGFEFFDFTSPEASDLKNERSRQVVLGVERPIAHGITLRAEAYHRAFDRLLVQRQETETERAQRLSAYDLPPDLPSDSAILDHRPTVHPQSVGTGRATGLELLVRRDRGRVTGWIAYTLSKAERDVYGRTVPFAFDRRHAIGAVVHVQLSPSVRVSATSQFASGFPITPQRSEVEFFRRRQADGSFDSLFRSRRHPDGSFFMSPLGSPLRMSLLNSERLWAYARTDVRVTWSPNRHWELYGEILNLFNRDNFAQPWEAGVSGIRPDGHLPIYDSLPRLPTYGVRVRF